MHLIDMAIGIAGQHSPLYIVKGIFTELEPFVDFLYDIYASAAL